jgi:hypothetical protein
MPASNVQRLFAVTAVAALAGTLAGCGGTTYGTGVTAEQQTLEGVMSIASLGSKDGPSIDYRPRGGIVVPPSDNLPTPGTTGSVATNDPNWPKDPDEARRKAKAAEAAAPIGQSSPNFVLPKGQTTFSVANAQQPTDEAAKKAAGTKAWKEKRQARAGSVDANGNPTRKYLTEPPVAYREADPNAPVAEPPKTKKKFDISKLWPF